MRLKDRLFGQFLKAVLLWPGNMAAVGSAIKTQAGRGKASYPIACALSMFACAVLLTTVSASGGTITSTGSAAVAGVVGICPPYKLRDEHGNIIDPVHGVNTNAPYSSRQTCGAAGCHDYNKITEGFHFQQGKGEAVPAWMAERYQWVTSPGELRRHMVFAGAALPLLGAQKQCVTRDDRHDIVHVHHRRMRTVPSWGRPIGVRSKQQTSASANGHRANVQPEWLSGWRGSVCWQHTGRNNG